MNRFFIDYYIVSLKVSHPGSEKDIIRLYIADDIEMTEDQVIKEVLMSERGGGWIKNDGDFFNSRDGFSYNVNYCKQITEEEYNSYISIISPRPPQLKAWQEQLYERASAACDQYLVPHEFLVNYVELKSREPSFTIDDLIDRCAPTELYIAVCDNEIKLIRAVDIEHATLLAIELVMGIGTSVEAAHPKIGDIISFSDLLGRK